MSDAPRKLHVDCSNPGHEGELVPLRADELEQWQRDQDAAAQAAALPPAPSADERLAAALGAAVAAGFTAAGIPNAKAISTAAQAAAAQALTDQPADLAVTPALTPEGGQPQ